MKTKLPEPEIIIHKGKALSVILPIEVYQEMIEGLEDAGDNTCLKKARKKPQSFRSLYDALAALGA